MKKVLLFSLAVLLTTSVFADDRILGGDLSLVPAYEEAGDVWLDADGNKIDDLLIFLRDEAHWNAVRVRLVVNPKYGNDVAICQDIDYVKELGKRIKDAKMNFLLDIFYSDTWADVSKQWIPTDWNMTKSTDLSELAGKVSSYTTEVLTELINYGATPDYVQIGNEVSYGMLWDSQSGGSNSNMFNCTGGYSSQSTKIDRFATLLTAGATAVREKLPNAKIILQCERSGSAASNFYDYVKSAGFTDYDIIGLSYYPVWQGTLSTLKTTLNNLASFDKPIQIVETAYYNDYMDEAWFASSDNVSACSWDLSYAGQAAFMEDLVATLKTYDNVTGLYYWFPEECGNGNVGGENGTNVLDSWLNRGLWDFSWSAGSHALSGAKTLDAMAEFLGYYKTVQDVDISDDYFANLDFNSCVPGTETTNDDWAGWTVNYDLGYTSLFIATTDQWTASTVDGYMFEIWNDKAVTAATGTILSQTSKTKLPAGDYTVSAIVHSEYAGFYLFANDKETEITNLSGTNDNTWDQAYTVSVNITLEDEAELTIGLKTTESIYREDSEINLYADNFKLTTEVEVETAKVKEIQSVIDKTIVGYYNLMGQKFDAPQKGINIIIYSDGSSQKTLVK